MDSLQNLSSEDIDRIWSVLHVAPIHSPWHIRTNWSFGLQGMSYRSVMCLKAAPNESNPEDPLNLIWKTMLRVAQTSFYIVSYTDLAIRTEVARIDPGLLPSPLEVDFIGTFEEHVRPWQEILAAICRGENLGRYGMDSDSKCYNMTPRQSRCFSRLWELASGPQNRDLIDKRQYDREARFVNSPLESACLAFCLSLLNQRAMENVNECTMIPVLALLGWEGSGWHTSEDYEVILWQLIQTARWMVVARSLELANDREDFVQRWCAGDHSAWTIADPLEDPEFDGVPDSELKRCRKLKEKPGRSFLGWVEHITQAFMTRKSVGPMQWMIQLWMDSPQLARKLDGPA